MPGGSSRTARRSNLSARTGSSWPTDDPRPVRPAGEPRAPDTGGGQAARARRPRSVGLRRADAAGGGGCARRGGPGRAVGGTATTRVTAMVAVIERVCWPLRFVGVRPARIGLVIAMALRFIPLIAERADRIREAQAARGGSVRGLKGLTTTVVPLLVQVLQLAHTVSEALDARGADDVPVRRGGARAA